jgi:hypothetical protein
MRGSADASSFAAVRNQSDWGGARPESVERFALASFVKRLSFVIEMQMGNADV